MIGGHFLERAAEFAVENFKKGATGKIEIVMHRDEKKGGIRLLYCEEIIATVMRYSLGPGEHSDEAVAKHVNELFTGMLEGVNHGVKAMHTGRDRVRDRPIPGEMTASGGYARQSRCSDNSTIERRISRNTVGVRIALGAMRRDVLRLVFRETTLIAVIGVAAGLVIALVMTRFVAALLYGVVPADPWSFGTSTIGLVLLTFLATYLPARRATRIDPLIAPAIRMRCDMIRLRILPSKLLLAIGSRRRRRRSPR